VQPPDNYTQPPQPSCCSTGPGCCDKREPPAPGSDEAVNRGCTCPVIDNARGVGYLGVPGVFVYTKGCPLHDDTDSDPERLSPSVPSPVCDTCGQEATGGFRRFIVYMISSPSSPAVPLMSLMQCRSCVHAMITRIHADYCKDTCKGKHDDFGPWAGLGQEGLEPA